MKSEVADQAEVFSADVGSQVLPPRKAIAITAGVLLGFFVIDGSYVWFEHPPRWELAAAFLGFAAILALQLGHSFPSLAPWPPRYRYGTWALQGLLTYLPILAFGVGWGGMTEFLTASAVLVFPAAIGWPLFCLAAAGDSLVFFHFGTGWETAVYAVIEAVLIPLIVIGLSRMSDMIVKLHRSREELSRLAVASERLRFARDLHDVLGFSLSAISLKCELAYRLLADAPARAQEELGEVLRTSRKALADVRSVSRGYREMSLSGEANAAASMLQAAGIRTSMKVDDGALPVTVDTVLATVLREGLTNMLRHSKAEQCEITAERRDGAAALILANDGIGRSRLPKTGAHGGLAALGSRVQELGGTLTHGCDGEGWFRLEAVVPLPAQMDREPGTSKPVVPEADDADRPTLSARGFGHPDMVPRAAAAITFAVLMGYFLAYSEVAMAYHPTFGHGLAVELCLSATLVIQLVLSFQGRFARTAHRPPALRYAALGALVLLQFVPPLFLGPTWVGLPGFVAGAAFLTLPAAAAWPLVAAVTAACGVELHLAGNTTWDITYQSAYTVMCGLVVFGLSRMAQLASELHRSRAEIARLAVTTERLRFARDLHDLLGFSLSAITLKCELVRRLAQTKPVQAQAELTEVLGIARQALADVRTVADGRQRMSLTAEAANATAMLAGVGIRATVDTDCGELPGDVDTVLATMVREGLTNMLRHSRAVHCEITAERTPAGVRLTLVNDGVDGGAAPGLDSKVNGGSGIGNLTTRVKAVNGRLVAGARPDGRFELKAEVALLTTAA
ncbi:histidine kinase [Streptomyces sp. ASQP_92]|uniref:sensor histidine kinase n=1 Tax=Streptomyces sp. ASQP_92 TaxID=2979116 RepID=UPI0021C0E357|nr:histidine kinase [Streptomyces sp. ASQP_92]MCT9087720.1 histidine kinase [Streptomyces sp. ASQP_92]